MNRERPSRRQQLEFLGVSFAVWIVGLLPYPALRHLAGLLGNLVWLCDSRGRHVALANLDAVFKDKFSPEQKTGIIRASYREFARTMLELFWSRNLTRSRAEAMGEIEGLEAPLHTDNRQPVIYLCLHSSNFELLSLRLSYAIGPGIVVAQQFKNPLLGKLFDQLRGNTGHMIIPQERAMIRMFRHLKEGGYFCMLADLNLDPSESSVVINEFGGLKTCVTQMHAALALRTGAKIVPAECRTLPGGGYRMIYHEPLEYSSDATAEQITQLCWDVLEPFILEHPGSWLWAYKHWRFKPSDDASGRYPFYANTAKRFDKLISRQALTPVVAMLGVFN